MGGQILETFLRDTIIECFSVTILLRRNHCNVNASSLPDKLFKRNNKLRGRLKAVKVKKYADDDVNANSTSRRQWRLVHLVADETFLNSLSKFSKNHKFCLGANEVTITGGIRLDGDKGTNPQNNLSNKIISSVVVTASEEVFQREEARERDQHKKPTKKKE